MLSDSSTKPATPRSVKLPSLNVGRFAAAMLVVLFHMTYMVHDFTGITPFHMLFRAGHSGVEYFFVLSGFIILWVHQRDIGQPGRITSFAMKRIVRIIPLLWLVIGAWGCIRLALPADPGQQLTPLNVLNDMLLLPHRGTQTLGVTWTLRREVIFYLMFALMIWRPRFGTVVMVAWQALVLLQAATGFFAWGPEPDMLFGIANIGFGIGMVLALVARQVRSVPATAIICAGTLLYALLMVAEWLAGGPLSAAYRPWGPSINPLLYIGAASVLVFGMVALDQTRAKSETKFSDVLGGSSYTLYLVHLPFASIAIRMLKPLWHVLPSEVLLLALTCGASVAAIIVHRFVEMPILDALSAHVRKRTDASRELSQAGAH